MFLVLSGLLGSAAAEETQLQLISTSCPGLCQILSHSRSTAVRYIWVGGPGQALKKKDSKINEYSSKEDISKLRNIS